MSEQIAERQPWDQLEGESQAAYARFLVYRNMGPQRSLRAAAALHAGKATDGHESLQVPGNWIDDSSSFNWVARSLAWDIHALQVTGSRIVVRYMSSLDALAGKVLEALGKVETKPDDWRGILDSISLLTSLIPAEAISSLAGGPGSGGSSGGAKGIEG